MPAFHLLLKLNIQPFWFHLSKQSQLSAALQNSDLEAGVTLLSLYGMFQKNHIWWQQLPGCPWTGHDGKRTCLPGRWLNVVSPSPPGSWFSLCPLDPITHPTDDDSKHLHKALQIRGLFHPLSHLILTMTLSGRKEGLYFYFYSTEEETEAQWRSETCPRLQG